ncbi:hypothetical protein ACCO45_002346 [Purpureocillium lilacinum]|uniref:Uncharacterized protein n=1 Tax=Purpureocillium lilacinum TaxID=33203 RepID=A0ACC4EAV2_PURLI
MGPPASGMDQLASALSTESLRLQPSLRAAAGLGQTSDPRFNDNELRQLPAPGKQFLAASPSGAPVPVPVPAPVPVRQPTCNGLLPGNHVSPAPTPRNLGATGTPTLFETLWTSGRYFETTPLGGASTIGSTSTGQQPSTTTSTTPRDDRASPLHTGRGEEWGECAGHVGAIWVCWWMDFRVGAAAGAGAGGDRHETTSGLAALAGLAGPAGLALPLTQRGAVRPRLQSLPTPDICQGTPAPALHHASASCWNLASLGRRRPLGHLVQLFVHGRSRAFRLGLRHSSTACRHQQKARRSVTRMTPGGPAHAGASRRCVDCELPHAGHAVTRVDAPGLHLPRGQPLGQE